MTLTLLIALLLPPPQGGRAPVRLERVGALEHPAIRETSGIVKSRRHDGIYWVHNDSGNAPLLFAVRRDGRLVREYLVKVPNVDWEDVTVDGDGHLYLGEIGNNEGRLPLRAIYQLDEPDPNAEGPRELKVKTASYYRFADKDSRFDAEGLVVDGKRALVVAKTFDGREAEVYAVPLDPPAPLLRPAVPERVGTLPKFVEPVTGASLSADGRRLAVCSPRAAGVYERTDGGKWALVSITPFEADDQIEAVTWDGDDLRLAGEQRGVFLLKPSPKPKPR